MSRMAISQEGFDAEWRMISIYDGRRRPDQPLRDVRRGRPRRRARAVRGAAARRRRGWKTRQARWSTAYQAYFAARDWDAMAEILADDVVSRRSPSGGERRGPTRVEHATSRTCEPPPRSAPTSFTSTVIATRGQRLALARVDYQEPRLRRKRGRDSWAFARSIADDRIAAVVDFDLDDIEPPSRNSTPGTSPAKRPPTRTHGRLSPRATAHSTGTNFPR